MLLLVFKVSVAMLILSIGMTATKNEIVYLWRRPILFLKSIVAMYIIMPMVAVLMMIILDLPPRTEVALVILGICAGAPLLPKKLIEIGGDPDYVFSLIVTTSLIAIITVPTSLFILAKAISLETADISPLHVARVLVRPFLLPLMIGMLFRLVKPKLADQIGSPMLKLASAIFALSVLTALILKIRLVLMVDLSSFLAFAIFTLSAIITGHLLGGPISSNRNALAVACASRHIGLALLIAANARGPHTLPLVAAYLVASTLVTVAYIKWVRYWSVF